MHILYTHKYYNGKIVKIEFGEPFDYIKQGEFFLPTSTILDSKKFFRIIKKKVSEFHKIKPQQVHLSYIQGGVIWDKEKDSEK